MKCYFLFIFILNHTFVVAQADTTTKVFSVRDLYAQIFNHHPIVQSINFIPQIAREEIRIARGNFDPKIEVDYAQKTLKNTFYYSYWDSHLKAPIWIGELKGGYEINEGMLIDPESKSPKQGLLYAGLSIPLGQGLLIDARRATLRQAQAAQTMAEADRIKELNKLFYNASKDYWDWFFTYNELTFIRRGYQLADDRYQFIKKRISFGDAAGIDSVEALITLQERTVQLRQAEVDFRNAGLVLSNYLWINDVPAELPANAIPAQESMQILGEARLGQLLGFAQENHPELQKIRFKLVQLEIERRFQQDRFKPRINLNYNLLSPYTDFNKVEVSNQYLNNNYKIGLDVSFPVLLRKERGKVSQTRFKLSQTRLEQAQTLRNITTEINTTYNEAILLEKNIVLQDAMVKNLVLLRNAEYQRFTNGESSVFLINARESKLIEAQIKLVALQSKYEKIRVELRWAAGERIWE